MRFSVLIGKLGHKHAIDRLAAVAAMRICEDRYGF
jgi:hypothetical protein